MMLEVGHHEEPKAHDHPWTHAHHCEVGSSQTVPQGSCRGDRHHDGQGGVQLLAQGVSLPHASVEQDVSTVGNAGDQVREVQERKVEHARGVRRLHERVHLVQPFANEPLMREVPIDVIVIQMMLSVRKCPWHEGRQAEYRMR